MNTVDLIATEKTNLPSDAQGPHSTTIPESRTVELLRRRASTPIALALTSAFGAGPARERFDALTDLGERIAKRVCEFLNSVYLHSARAAGPVPEMERHLVELGRKNMSFGDYVRSIDFLLRTLGAHNLDAAVRPFWDEFAVPLRAPNLPQSVSEDLAGLESLKTAREKYEVPVSTLERFIEDQRSGGPKKASLTTVLNTASAYRNAKAHHHPWFPDDPRWHALITERWRRVLEQVVLHEPVWRLLSAVEVVSTRADMRMAEPGRLLCDASRDELHELLRPMAESRLESGVPLVAGRHWVRGTDGDAPLQWMFPWRDFPENVEPPTVREQRYRSRIVTQYLAVGTLRATDVDSVLHPLKAELGIDDKAAVTLREEVVQTLRAAETEARGGEDKGAMDRLLVMIRHFEADFPELKRSLVSLDRQRAQTIHMLIADQFPISHASLVRASEMDPEDLERALQSLLAEMDPTRVVRKVEPAPGKAYYRIPSARDTAEFVAAMEEVRSQPDLAKALRPMLEVCQQFFAEEGHPELPAAIERLLRDSSGRNEAPLVTEEPPRLLFEVQGQVIERSSVPELFREVVRQFGTDQSLQRSVPFASGRKRNLVSRDGRHVAGHPFVAPLEFHEAHLVFEANQSRISALKNLPLQQNLWAQSGSGRRPST